MINFNALLPIFQYPTQHNASFIAPLIKIKQVSSKRHPLPYRPPWFGTLSHVATLSRGHLTWAISIHVLTYRNLFNYIEFLYSSKSFFFILSQKIFNSFHFHLCIRYNLIWFSGLQLISFHFHHLHFHLHDVERLLELFGIMLYLISLILFWSVLNINRKLNFLTIWLKYTFHSLWCLYTFSFDRRLCKHFCKEKSWFYIIFLILFFT